MKKFTILLALVILVAMPTFAEHVTPETARKVASTFLKNNGAKANQLTDLSKAAGFPNLYIFTADEGFVVMAADDCVKPILGYSLTNKFVAEGMPENISSWLQGYNDEIQWAIEDKQKASYEVAQQWKDLVTGKLNKAKVNTVVGPLIQTEWDQSPYYNNLCPYDSINHVRTVTGCVATAMAQIMKYWEYPSHGIGSHSYTPKKNPTLGEQYANFGETYFNWSNMPISLSSSSSADQINSIASLMYLCGVSVDMDYDYSQYGTSHVGSSTSTEQAALAFKTYFNYSSSIEYKKKSEYDDATWMDMLKAELDANRPLQYRGRNPNSSGSHSFICDGYDDKNNFNFNWGWGSSCNGLFSLDKLKPDYDHNYTSDQAAIFGIQPIECYASEPTNLTLDANERNITLNWTAADGASSYNIYCNNTCVGNSIATTYSTTAAFGTNAYYVRSMDANNSLSLSSNIVTSIIDYQIPVVNDLTTSFSNNNFSLSWTNPNWCYPDSPTDILTYGEKEMYYFWPSYYYAHRYLATELGPYSNKLIYKISTYIYFPGTYTVYIYTNTSNDQPDENSLSATKSIIATGTSGWLEFTFDNPIILSGTTDLWIVIKPENIEQAFPIPSFTPSAYNGNACYASSTSPTSLSSIHYIQNQEYIISWFIKTYLTDGTYTYNLYQDGTKIAENISETTYSNANLNNNAPNLFTVKTNYYGGETDNSNKVGFAKGDVSLSTLNLASNDKLTITENSILTVNGTLTNTNADNLIIEDGGQLITSSDDVAATVKKTITGHEPNDLSGWKFIASPVSTAINPRDGGLITDTYGNSISDEQPASYDLYYYDESQKLPWKNYRKNSFSLENGKGYLYANNETIDLAFAGTLYNGDGVVPLAYHDGYLYKGWNLVGNPFTCDASIDRPFFIINGRNLKASTGTIPPCTGVMVQAAAVDTTHNTIDYNQIAENVTFTKVNPSSATSLPNQLQITVAQQVVNRDGISTLRQAQGSETIDNAIVSFNKGNLLEKFVFNADLAKLYIPQNGKDFAIVTSEGIGEMPLNFSAAEDGTYTLTVNPEGVEMNYLHLIDNLTGDDVDLLASPDYTFEAKTTDYASRFRLVFASVCEDTDDDNENFAFINDGNIIVYKEGTLQIIDITGRIVLSGDAMNRVSTNRMTPGVYVLRLITANGVKTQKIVID